MRCCLVSGSYIKFRLCCAQENATTAARKSRIELIEGNTGFGSAGVLRAVRWRKFRARLAVMSKELLTFTKIMCLKVEPTNTKRGLLETQL